MIKTKQSLQGFVQSLVEIYKKRPPWCSAFGGWKKISTLGYHTCRGWQHKRQFRFQVPWQPHLWSDLQEELITHKDPPRRIQDD